MRPSFLLILVGSSRQATKVLHLPRAPYTYMVWGEVVPLRVSVKTMCFPTFYLTSSRYPLTLFLSHILPACLSAARPLLSPPHGLLASWPSGKASASRATDLGSIPVFTVDHFLGRTSDLNISSPVATLPGSRRDRFNAGTGWPGVNVTG